MGRSDGATTGGSALRARLRAAGPMVALLCLVVGVLAGLAVLPARTWKMQRDNLVEAEAELDRVEAEVAELEAELTELQTDAAVERLAREHFDLVYPGDESYVILDPEAP
ncbi:MAG: septum formation initiator family protein [Actinomycetota bacterium]